MKETSRVRPAWNIAPAIPNVGAGQLVREVFWSLIVIGLPFVIYLRTLAPTVYGLDSAELTTGAYTLGIVHAPGAPLYLIIGNLFTRLPFGDVGYRMNLFSACACALSVWVVYRLMYRLTSGRGISITTAWILAFSYYFWTSALYAEIYAFQALLAATLIWLGVAWYEDGFRWQLYLLAFLFGVGLGAHLSLILFAPGLLFLIVSRPGLTKKPTIWLFSIILLLLGASIYLYLPIRYLSDASLNYARDYWGMDLSTWRGFWWMVTGRMFAGFFMAVPIKEIPGEVGRYFLLAWSNFLRIGLILGLVGFFANFKIRPRVQFALTLMMVFYLAFYVSYGVIDKEVMYLPTYVIWAVWVGSGAHFLGAEIQRRFSISKILAPLALFLVALSALVINYQYADLSQDWSARQVGQRIMNNIDDNAWYFGTWRDVPILEYLQIVDGSRPDINHRNMFFMSVEASHGLAYQRLLAGDSVYTSMPNRFSPGEFVFRYSTSCNCYQISLRTESK